MDLLDITIAGAVLLATVFGLRSGVLAPASGLLGIALGIALAVQYHAELSAELATLLDDPAIRDGVSFIAIVLVTAIVTKTAASALKRLLSMLGLGWVDHVAGAALGLSVGVLVSGTVVYLLAGADSPQVQSALAASSLAPAIAEASVLRATGPWCAELRRSAAPEQGCVDMAAYAREMVGSRISDRLSRLLGRDAEPIAEIVMTTLSGSPDDLVRLAQDEK